MQRNNNNNSRKLNTPAYKTFCKVCQDSGKPEKEYTNHNVRDKTGKTVCPTLLAQECRNCYKHGHTVKYCTLIKAAVSEKKPYQAPIKVAQPKSQNVFMVFDDDSDSEPEQIEEFPSLKQDQQKQRRLEPLNYSLLINMTEQETKEAALKKLEIKPQEVKVVLPKVTYQSQKGKLNWATAESDSEGDEDEEDYYPTKYQQKQDDLSAW